MTVTRNENRERGDLPAEDFLRAGDRALRWIARYLEETREFPVRSSGGEGELLAAIPDEMPEEGEPLERIEEDFVRIVLPHVTHWNHPRFFAYFAITGSMPGILGELYSAALNTNAMKWITCPASVELEKGMLLWLGRALGLPDAFSGILADAASTSTLLSLAVAREKATGFDCRRRGLGGRSAPLRLYASEEAHVSVEKAAILLGIGLDHVARIPSDRKYRLDPGALRERVRADRAAGLLPFAVVATAGTTATNSVDPIPAIAEIAEEEGLWLHVDAAYAGAAALLPEKRGLFAGWERADTIVVNPHKWLFTPIDASAFFFRDPDAFRRAFSVVPEYLRTADEADNPMDYGFQLGRRFRALKLWFVFRAYGRRGIEERIRHHIRLAREFADWIDGDPEWERLAPAPFSTVCFRWLGHAGRPRTEEDLAERNEALLERINRSGEAYLSHAALKGRAALRLAVGNVRTTRADVQRVREKLIEEARAV
ncbi:MAG: pyridoxal-dependent decarboxylase [Candidatus Eisenbacteria bacterium]